MVGLGTLPKRRLSKSKTPVLN